MTRAFILMLVCALVGIRFSLSQTYKKAAHEVCDLIDQHYYRKSDPDVEGFLQWCQLRASQQNFLFSRQSNIVRINDRLAKLRVSHLYLYAPEENKAVWENVGLDTGIRVRMIDGELVVYRLLKNSPALRAGLREGDIILAVGEKPISSVSAVQSVGGSYKIDRAGEQLTFDVATEVVQDDLSFELTEKNGVSVLRVPSFLPQYFDGPRWAETARKLEKASRVVIDLRENAGGSFPAMLRVLSPFRCADSYVGRIYQAEVAGKKADVDLLDRLEATSQLEQLSASNALNLRVFATYGCAQADVTVLIDSDTSSVAEIFAAALLKRAHSRVWGQPSAGQVVLAQWFPVKGFGGSDYALSIPVAGYVSDTGRTIEGEGVLPERELHYDLSMAVRGQDSWLIEASRARERSVSK